MALFKSYAVIYLPIDAAIYDVLQVSHTLSISLAPPVRPLTTASVHLVDGLSLQYIGLEMHLNG